jgi:hypothetical protein
MITGTWIGDALLWVIVATLLWSMVVSVFGDHEPPGPPPPFEPD